MRADRRRRWDDLADLLTRVDRRGVASLPTVQVKRLGALYRQETVDLSQARAAADDPGLVHFLNALTARAHGRVYAAKPLRSRRRPDQSPPRSSATTSGWRSRGSPSGRSGAWAGCSS